MSTSICSLMWAVGGFRFLHQHPIFSMSSKQEQISRGQWKVSHLQEYRPSPLVTHAALGHWGLAPGLCLSCGTDPAPAPGPSGVNQTGNPKVIGLETKMGCEGLHLQSTHGLPRWYFWLFSYLFSDQFFHFCTLMWAESGFGFYFIWDFALLSKE